MVQRFLLCGFLLSVMALTGCSIEMDKPMGGGGGNGNGLYLAGWIRTGGVIVPRQYSFYDNMALYNEINPVWYDITKTNLENGTYDAELYTRAKQRGVKVIPTLQNIWDKNTDGVGKVNTLLATEESRQKHVADVVKLVNEKNFDGIDIDYEGAIANTNHQFDLFLELLSAELAKTNKLLSVCINVPVKGIAPSWQNPEAWLKYVDSLKVMVYNCDLTVNPVPQPICSLSHLRATLSFARNNPAAKGKIVIGLPFYGRKWLKNSDGSYKHDDSLLYVGVQEILKAQGITADQILRKDGEAYFTYQDTTGAYTVFFQDYLALRTRLEVIAPYRDVIKGVTFWELGGEDPASWNEVAKYK